MNVLRMVECHVSSLGYGNLTVCLNYKLKTDLQCCMFGKELKPFSSWAFIFTSLESNRGHVERVTCYCMLCIVHILVKLPLAHNITHTVVIYYCCLLCIECDIIVHHDHDVVIGDTMIVEDLIGVAHISLLGGQGLEVKNQSDILCGWVHLGEGLARRSKSLMMWPKRITLWEQTSCLHLQLHTVLEPAGLLLI